MQILPAPGVAQPNAALPAASAAAPVAPAVPLEPERRVTANRDSGRSDLQARQQPQKSARTPARGRLLDLFV